MTMAYNEDPKSSSFQETKIYTNEIAACFWDLLQNNPAVGAWEGGDCWENSRITDKRRLARVYNC